MGQLVLTREATDGLDQIVIEGGIVITVLGIQGAKVRIGVIAPGLRVDRKEIADRISARGIDTRPPVPGSRQPPDPARLADLRSVQDAHEVGDIAATRESRELPRPVVGDAACDVEGGREMGRGGFGEGIEDEEDRSC